MKTLLFCLFSLIGSNLAAKPCFVAKDNSQIIQKQGNPDQEYSPCSTFKIALAVMGFDSKILQDETHPVWPFQKGYVDSRDAWKQDMDPTTWIKESCVWYSQVLTKKLGMPNFKKYVRNFKYGNMDLSGDKGQNNGLTQSWLGSSLRISSTQQIAFLEKLIRRKLHVSPAAYTITKKILFVEELKNGWKLYGKTGTGSLINKDGSKNPDLNHGWFVGWIEKGDQYVVFSNHLEDQKKEDVGAGKRAREDAKDRLSKIIESIDRTSKKVQTAKV